MNFKKSVFSTILAALLLFAAAPPGGAAGKPDLENREYDVGIAAGLWLGGTVNISDYYANRDLDKDPGPYLKVFGDMFMSPKFSTGAYLSYSSTTLSYGSTSLDATAWELGFSFKGKFLASPTMAIKPGLSIGYRYMDLDRSEDSTVDGLAINMSVEFQFPTEGGYIFFAETGFLTQPTGGTSEQDVTWGPIFYLCGGIVF